MNLDKDDNSSYNNDYNGNYSNQDNNNYNNPNFNNNYSNQDNNCNNPDLNNNYNNQGYNNNINNNYHNKNQSNGYAVASLILGILSIPAACCYGFGLILAIVGIIFGFLSKKQTNGRLTGLAIAGIILSILGILTSIVMIIIYVIILTDADFLSQLESITNSTYSNSSFY